jgi:hypothetical protein
MVQGFVRDILANKIAPFFSACYGEEERRYKKQWKQK